MAPNDAPPLLPPGLTAGLPTRAGDGARLVISAVAAVAIVLAPAMLGSSGPWPRLAVETAMAVSAVLWALFLCREPRVLAALLVVCGLASLQLIVLPEGILETVAPLSAKSWRSVGDGAAPGWHPISVDPAATAAGIRRLLLWLAMALSMREVATRRGGRIVLATSLALSGAIVWGLAAAFPVDEKHPRLLGTFEIWGPTTHFWKNGSRLPLESDGGGFLDRVDVGAARYLSDQVMAGDGAGPYWSSNQFACALVVTVPFLLAACVAAGRRAGRPRVGAGAALLVAGGAAWTLWEVHSRAGFASLLLGLLVFLQAAVTARWGRRIAAVGAAGCAAGILVFVAGYTGVLPGLERLAPESVRPGIRKLLANPRAAGTVVAATMVRGSPLVGIGIDAYPVLYPIVHPRDYAFYTAYNEYAQLAAETGVLGIGIAIALVAPLAVGLSRRRAAHGSGDALAAAAVGALAGVAANMLFEWTLRQPANGLLSCVAVGLGAAIAGDRGGAEAGPWRPAAPDRRIVAGLFAAACCLALLLLVRDAWSDVVWRDFRRALDAARPVPWRGERPDPVPLLERAIERGRRAAAWDRSNPRLALVEGQARLHLAELVDGSVGASHRAAAEECFRRARRLWATPTGQPEPAAGSER